jgi:hypothetical protein
MIDEDVHSAVGRDDNGINGSSRGNYSYGTGSYCHSYGNGYGVIGGAGDRYASGDGYGYGY